MRLRKMSVSGLFGLFNHEVPFNLERRITLIHAPNGFGKTVILKLIAGFFGGSLSVFREIEYSEIVFEFDDTSYITINKAPAQPELDLGIRRRTDRGYLIRYNDGESEQIFDPDEVRASDIERITIQTANIERFLPNLRRAEPGIWLDIRTRRSLNIHEVISMYGESLPRSLRTRIRTPDGLEKVRSSINCRLINAQRLFTTQKKEGLAHDEEASTPTVKTYSNALAQEISSLLANSAIYAQRLDQTFPNRILQRMSSGEELPNENELRERLEELIKKRERLSSVGLLDTREVDDLISHDHFDNNTRRMFAVYIGDTTKKLKIYDETLAKLELFKSILNSRLQFKQVSFNKDKGFEFRDIRQRVIPPESLSSGEQHELVLNFDLLFNSRANTLILIDEPEISLHIAWQKRFLPDLERIINLTDVDTVLCTHSPQLIGGYIDLAVQLRAPDGENSDD